MPYTYFYTDTHEDSDTHEPVETWANGSPLHGTVAIWKHEGCYTYFEAITGILGALSEAEYAAARAKGLTI